MIGTAPLGVRRPFQAAFAVLKRAFELAGIEFIDENGGGPAYASVNASGRK